MQGYVFVDAEGIRTGVQLCFWLERRERFVATLPLKAAKAKPGGGTHEL